MVTSAAVTSAAGDRAARWRLPGRLAALGIPVALVLAIGLGCSGLIGGADDQVLVAPAEALLASGDLPGASAEYQKLYAEHPESVPIAVGYAYVQLLGGDIVGADTTLATIEPTAGDKAGEIRLRRALVALDAKDFDRVEMLGEASGLPEGKLLAAEVHLVDLESDKAVALLKEVAPSGGVVGETATTYLSLIESTDQHKASLAEASALWALGDRSGACEAVKESLKALAEDDPDKDTLLLLWAGRAVSSGRPEIAKDLLEDLFPPPGQQWRYHATLAMVALAEGDSTGALAKFAALKEDPATPADGLADALATACTLTKDVAVAEKLVEGLNTAGAARCMSTLGAAGAAERAPSGPLQSFLGAQ
ncbi:MAG: tetratricopeptide repeat protein [Myxococcota bacterium]